MAALGHEVVEAAPAWPSPDALEIFINVFGPAVALGIRRGRAADGPRAGRGRPRAALARVYERAQATPTLAYLGAQAQLQAIARGLVAFFADHDLLMTPALAEQ